MLSLPSSASISGAGGSGGKYRGGGGSGRARILNVGCRLRATGTTRAGGAASKLTAFRLPTSPLSIFVTTWMVQRCFWIMAKTSPGRSERPWTLDHYMLDMPSNWLPGPSKTSTWPKPSISITKLNMATPRPIGTHSWWSRLLLISLGKVS